MPKLRLMLAGGGDATDSLPLDETFAGWTRSAHGGGRMLFLPVAMDGGEAAYETSLRWVESMFGPLGISDIEMWEDLGAPGRRPLSDFSSVYVSGGNTFRLLDLVRSSGFGPELVGFARRGGAVYGGSAGAILLGKDIVTCARMDPNDVGLEDTRGLDLVSGHDIWCHYEPADDALIREYVAERRTPVLALSERSGLRVEGERVVAWGREPAFKFSTQGKQRVGVGDRVPARA